MGNDSEAMEPNMKTGDLVSQSVSESGARAPTWLDVISRRFVLNTLAAFPNGSIMLEEPDGNTVPLGSGEPRAVLKISDWRAYRMLFSGGGLGAGEAYMEGLWHSEDLVRVVRYFAANIVPMQRLDGGLSRLGAPVRHLLHYWNRNSLTGSRRNIAAHYDLGNDFFELFLDPEMMYSSAIFTAGETSLDKAARAKLDLICSKLDLKPHHHLLEVGTGWGGMAIHAARYYGCKVTTTTISAEQYAYAKARVAALGLEDRVTVLDQDYRALTGEYDRLVSVEMIEAVGHQFLPTYFSTLQKLLKPDGLALIQAITIPEQRYKSALRNMDFIKRYIFPGGFLPSVALLCQGIAEHTGWVTQDIQDIGRDYGITLKYWRQRFLAKLEQVREQGFDDRFVRMWDYYLAYCQGGFEERAISTVQLLAAGPDWRP